MIIICYSNKKRMGGWAGGEQVSSSILFFILIIFFFTSSLSLSLSPYLLVFGFSMRLLLTQTPVPRLGKERNVIEITQEGETKHVEGACLSVK